jgi:hypothetical protein
VEATSDELLGAYTKGEDEVVTIAFGAHGKRRLNRFFDVIGFFYPDYCFPARKQGLKRKMAASSSSTTPKPKKIKVLTHRPRPHPIEKTVAVLAIEKMKKAKHAEAIPLAPEAIPAATVKASIGPAEEHPKLLNPPPVTELSKPTSIATTTITPKKRRMANILDVVLKSTKTPTFTSTEASDEKIEDVKEVAAASASSIHIEAGPLRAMQAELVKESLPEKPTSPVSEAPAQSDLDYIVRHASRKWLSKEQIAEVHHFAKDLKYP